jgi:prepilin-type N-terminal cleavage/methylation domain-containing protein
MSGSVPRRERRRAGFTLIETLIAVVLLAIVSLSLMRFSGLQLRGTASVGVRMVATGVATERLGQVRSDLSYATLGTRWAGSSTGFPGYPSMVRTTTVRRVQRTTPVRSDYTVITVTVTDPSLSAPVSVTSVVAAP